MVWVKGALINKGNVVTDATVSNGNGAPPAQTVASLTPVDNEALHGGGSHSTRGFEEKMLGSGSRRDLADRNRAVRESRRALGSAAPKR